MEDKSSNVRKAAMQLVMTLLQYNPFGPVLDEPRLVATLSAHAAKLQVLTCGAAPVAPFVVLVMPYGRYARQSQHI